METKLVLIKTLTSEILRHEFCLNAPCCSSGCCDAKGKREAEKMNAEEGVPQDGPSRTELQRCKVAVVESNLGDAAAIDKSKSDCRDIIHCSTCSKEYVD